MNLEDMAQAIEKLQYQVRMLGETISSKEHPIESMMLSNNWGEEEIDKANDIFEKYEKVITGGGTLKQYDFEKDFERKLGVGYQGVKSVVLAFYHNHQWTDVCVAYVKSHGSSPPIEFNSIVKGFQP